MFRKGTVPRSNPDARLLLCECQEFIRLEACQESNRLEAAAHHLCDWGGAVRAQERNRVMQLSPTQ